MRTIYEWAWFCAFWRRHFIALTGTPAFSYVRPDLLSQSAANDAHGGPAAA